MFDERLDTAPPDDALHEWSARMEAVFSEAPIDWRWHWLREKTEALHLSPERDIAESIDPADFPADTEVEGIGANWIPFALTLLLIVAWVAAIVQFGTWQGWW